MSVEVRKTATGYDGAGSIRFGKSELRFLGHLDQEQIEQARGLLQKAGQWVEARGPLAPQSADFQQFQRAVDTGADLSSAIAGAVQPAATAVVQAAQGQGWAAAGSGLHAVSSIAASIGGPYGGAVAAVAEVVADVLPAIQVAADPNYNSGGKAIAAMAQTIHDQGLAMAVAVPDGSMLDGWVTAGIITPPQKDALMNEAHAILVAKQLTSKDPKVQAKAGPVVDAVAKGVRSGDALAKQAQLMIGHKVLGQTVTTAFDEANKTILRLRDRLAYYGDPLSYGDTGDASTGVTLDMQLDQALARAHNDPQPTFKRRKAV